MLVADLFEIKKKEFDGKKLTATVDINADNNIFKGHFPNNPVAPGVMQVQLVKELVELQVQKDLELVTMSRCKFLAILNPVKTPTIEVEVDITEVEGQYNVKAGGKSSNEVYFKFFATYK